MRRATYVFGLLSDEDIEWLASQGERRALAPGEVLVEQGRPLPHVIIQLEGDLSVTVLGVGEVAILGPGEIIGEMSFVDPAPPSATVTAINAGEALLVEKSLLAGKLGIDVAFAARFYQALAIFLAHRLRVTVRRIGETAGGSRVPVETNAHREHLADAGARFQHLLTRLGMAA